MQRLLLLFLLAFSPTAWAACGSDMDCKGSRICEQGVCVEPAAGSSAPATRQAPPTDAFLKNQHDNSKRRSLISWGLVGGTWIFGLPAVGLGLADAYWVAPTALGAVALGFAGAGGIVAGMSGAQARHGTDRLGLSPPGGMRLTAWVLYGAGVGIGMGAVIGGLAQSGPAAGGFGGVALGLFTGSVVLFNLDASQRRDELSRGMAGRTPLAPQRPRIQLALIPVLDKRAPGMALVGAF